MLQIEPCSARISGQEHAAAGIVAEAFHQRRALFRRHAAMETDIADPARLQPTDNNVLSARPLAEHDRFRARIHE